MIPRPQIDETGRVVTTGIFTLHWPNLAKPSKQWNKYGFRAVFDSPNDPTIALLKQAAKRAQIDVWGEISPAVNIKIMSGDDPVVKSKKSNQGLEGKLFINCSSDRVFSIYNGMELLDLDSADPNEIAKAAKEINKVFYAGCKCRAKVYAHPYQGEMRGVSFIPNSLQFWADGERIGGRDRNQDSFDDSFSKQHFAEDPTPPMPGGDDIPF